MSLLIINLLVSSADNFCKKFGTHITPDKTKHRALSGPKLFDILETIFKKVNFEKISRRQKCMKNYPRGKEVILYFLHSIIPCLSLTLLFADIRLLKALEMGEFT